MDPKIYWLFSFVIAYWIYCIFWGIKGALQSKTATDYFIAGRQIPVWVFVLAATSNPEGAALQGAAIATGFPFAILLLVLTYSTFKGLVAERKQPFLETVNKS